MQIFSRVRRSVGGLVCQPPISNPLSGCGKLFSEKKCSISEQGTHSLFFLQFVDFLIEHIVVVSQANQIRNWYILAVPIWPPPISSGALGRSLKGGRLDHIGREWSGLVQEFIGLDRSPDDLWGIWCTCMYMINLDFWHRQVHALVWVPRRSKNVKLEIPWSLSIISKNS